MPMLYYCDACGNQRRFTMVMTRKNKEGYLYSVRALVVQEPDGVYVIKGTESEEDGRGPAGILDWAHLFCGKCGSNKGMESYNIVTKQIKGYKGIGVFDGWNE